MKIIKNLTYLGQVGPLNPFSSSQGNEEIMFIPEKDGAGGITLQAGFVYSQDPQSGQQIAFFAYDGTQGRYIVEGGPLGPGPLSTDAYPNYLVQSVKDLAIPHHVIVFSFNDITPLSNNRLGLMTGDPIGHTFTGPVWDDLTGQTTGDFGMGPYAAIGVSIIPTNNPAWDRAYMLLADTVTGLYREGSYHLQNAPVLSNNFNLRTAELDLVGYGVLPAGLQRVLYYYDSSSTNAYAMWNTGSHWNCVKWTESPPTVPLWQPMPGIDHRIDALLTTGELFSTEGDTARVYDPTTSSGSLEAEFPLGNLRFIGEVYVSGTPLMLFSMAVWTNYQVNFNVYSIPTSQLKTLGQ